MTNNDYYSLLKIPRHADKVEVESGIAYTREEIRYRRSDSTLMEIKSASEILLNDEKREEYDCQLNGTSYTGFKAGKERLTIDFVFDEREAIHQKERQLADLYYTSGVFFKLKEMCENALTRENREYIGKILIDVYTKEEDPAALYNMKRIQGIEFTACLSHAIPKAIELARKKEDIDCLGKLTFEKDRQIAEDALIALRNLQPNIGSDTKRWRCEGLVADAERRLGIENDTPRTIFKLPGYRGSPSSPKQKILA